MSASWLKKSQGSKQGLVVLLTEMLSVWDQGATSGFEKRSLLCRRAKSCCSLRIRMRLAAERRETTYTSSQNEKNKQPKKNSWHKKAYTRGTAHCTAHTVHGVDFFRRY